MNSDDAFQALIKEFGWEAFESALVGELGFTLASETALEDGATRRVYTHPGGNTVAVTYIEGETNDQPDRDSNQYEK